MFLSVNISPRDRQRSINFLVIFSERVAEIHLRNREYRFERIIPRDREVALANLSNERYFATRKSVHMHARARARAYADAPLAFTVFRERAIASGLRFQTERYDRGPGRSCAPRAERLEARRESTPLLHRFSVQSNHLVSSRIDFTVRQKFLP